MMPTRKDLLRVGLGWLALAAAVLLVAGPRTDAPGLYYDEAFMAQQAKDFLEPGRGLAHPASARQTELFGRPFPLRNAVYLGALKSQLTIPSFVLFGATTRVLRITTLAWSLLALLLLMLWATRLVGARAALVGGALVACDPSWWFLSLYEWGPFTTALLSKGAGLLLVTAGWSAGRPWAVAAGGVALGLGVFSRADFGVVILGMGLALLALRPDLAARALGSDRRLLAALALGGIAGASPMWTSIPDLLATTGSPVVSGRGDLAEKLRVLWSLADGSHFHRLMEVGGRFDRMFDAPAPRGLFGWTALAALLGVAMARARARGAPRGLDGPLFLALAGILVTAGTVALPGAVRAHHLMNAVPFFHLLVGYTLVQGFEGGGARRAIAALALAAIAAPNLYSIARTYELIERTGGRGRWSDATVALARELEADPERMGVALDWGRHEPLLFLTRRARLVEPFWEIRETVRARGAWERAGAAGDVYVVHDRDYDLFGFGPPFLASARRLAAREPGSVTIRAHRDREGATAFWTVRFARDHELRFREAFRIRLRDPSGTPPPP